MNLIGGPEILLSGVAGCVVGCWYALARKHREKSGIEVLLPAACAAAILGGVIVALLGTISFIIGMIQFPSSPRHYGDVIFTAVAFFMIVGIMGTPIAMVIRSLVSRLLLFTAKNTDAPNKTRESKRPGG